MTEWCDRYVRAGNPLFIPEARNGADAGVEALYAMGQHDAIGYSPFAVENMADRPESAVPLRRGYEIIEGLAPIIAQSQGRGAMAGFLLDKEASRTQARLGGYRLDVVHDHTFEWSSAPKDAPVWPRTGGLVIATAPGEYLVAGSGMIVTFAPDSAGEPIAGILAVDEGTIGRGAFVARRRLNGDETHQGRHVRIPAGQFSVQRVRLYRYR